MKKTISSKVAGFLIVSMVSMTAGVIPAFAAVTSSGPNNPGTVVSSTIGVSGDVAWSNVNNAKTSNNSHATVDLGATPSEFLKATGFGFAIPAGAVINGVQASIERKQTCILACPVTDNIVKLVKAGTVTGTNKANTSTAWPTTDASATYGSASDMWGATWTVEDINDTNFGLALSVKRNAALLNKTAEVDAMSVTVYYTVNAVPVAQTKSITLNEDASITSNVVATDADSQPSALTYSIVANPTNGAISGFNSSTGAFTYTPTLNYNGSDSFTFKANDGVADSNTATVSITVTSINDIPVATAASYTTDEDTVKSITLVATDVDVPAQTLTYGISDTSDAHGTVSLSGNTVTYTPALNYNGPASFKFTAKDGIASSTQATITLTVTSVNDVPVTVGDSVATHMNTAKTVSLGANDVDVPAQTLTRSIVSGPSHGTLGTVGATVIYTPATDYVGADSFTFKANDGTTDSNVSTIAISVNDDAPVLGTIGDKSVVNELSELAFTASATDPNEGDTLTYSLVGSPTGASIDSVTGAFSWTPTEAQGPAEYTFAVRVSDGAITDSETITVTVGEVNSTPVPVSLTGEDQVSITEDTVTDITLSATDSDIPTQTLTYALVALPSHGTATVDGTTVTYTPDLNYYGPDSFTFTVTDGVVDPVSAQVELYVDPINDAPVVTIIGSTRLLLTEGYAWEDQGATAMDAEDGDLTSSIERSGYLDMNTIGEYTLTYSVTDSGRDTMSEGDGPVLLKVLRCGEDERCGPRGLTGTATRVVVVLPRIGGSGGTDARVGCTDPKATNYDASVTYGGGTCTYAPAGQVLGASTTTESAPQITTESPAGQVLGVSASCKETGLYLTKFAREGYKNDVDTVKKLQQFLNDQLGLHIPVTGYFGPQTTAALKKFQLLHKDTMLAPWKLERPTGILYLTTLAGINKLICSEVDATIVPKDLIPFNQHPNAPKR